MPERAQPLGIGVHTRPPRPGAEQRELPEQTGPCLDTRGTRIVGQLDEEGIQFRHRLRLRQPRGHRTRLGRRRHIADSDRQESSAGSAYSLGRLTTIASCVLRAITTTASSDGSGFSSRCGT